MKLTITRASICNSSLKLRACSCFVLLQMLLLWTLSPLLVRAQSEDASRLLSDNGCRQVKPDAPGTRNALAALELMPFESIRATFQQQLDTCLALVPTLGLQKSIFGLLGDAYYHSGRYGDAIPLYRYLIQRLGDPVNRVGDYYGPPFWSSPSRVGGNLLYFHLTIYPNLVNMLVQSHQTDDALEIAEIDRAGQLAAIMQTRHFPNEKPTTASLNVAAIQALAKAENTTFIFYSLLNDQTVGIWTLSSNHVCFSKSAFHGSDNWDDVITTSTSGQNQMLHMLYEQLIAPIASCLPPDPQSLVTVIPDGPIVGIPFYALLDSRDKPLIESHTLSITPSIHVLQILLHLANSRVPSWNHMAGNDVLIVGNPTMPTLPHWVSPSKGEKQGGSIRPGEQLPQLPGAEDEAKDIASLFGADAYIGAKAVGSSIVQRIPDARLIHLATHGLLLNSALLNFGMQSISMSSDMPPGAMAVAPVASERSSDKTGEQRDDGLKRGFLTSGEILTLDLQADLVVLSACNTAGGRISEEEIVGLPTSLMASGAHSVIMTLWSIPDSPTAELMQNFYQQLRSGSTKAQALRQAMLWTKQRYPRLSDWGAFMLIGLPQ